MNARRVVSIGLLTMATALLSGKTLAMDPPKPAFIESAEFLTIALKHVDVMEMAPTIEALIRPLGGVAIPIVHMNAIIISGPKGRLDELRKLIEQLDVAPRKPATQDQLKVFSLKTVAMDKNLENVLNLVLRGRENTRWAIDPARNQVIVYGDQQITDMVSALLSRLESATELKSNSDMQIRVIWLVNGASTEKAPKMPDDVGPLLPTLARMGIDRPVLAAQTMVTVAPDTAFVAKGAATVDNTAPSDVSVSGMASEHKNGSRMSLKILAVQGKQEVSRLETEITAPLGHIVVLGTTPIAGSLTSVFLVQLKRVEPLAGGK